MSKLVRWTCVFALGCVGLFAQSTAPPVVVTTGMVGLAEGQTARLNVLNPGVLPPAVGVICTAMVAFVDGGGKVLKSAAIVANPGQSGGLNLDSQADLNLPVNGREEIRALISVPGAPPTAASSSSTPNQPVGACKVIPTLEIFDTFSGHTLVTLGHVEQVPPE